MVSLDSRSRGRGVRDALPLAAIAGADLALHLALSGRYGYWIDELYFIACGEHLDWGYVDHPPLVAVAAKLPRLLLGESLLALRLLPALAGAATIFLGGWLARALGGGRAAQILAAVAVGAVPVYSLFASVLTMNSFDPLLWMTCAYLVIRMAQGSSPRLWLAFGAVAGIGLLNKYAIGFFAGALVAGLLLSQRRLLATVWFWLGGLLAFAIVFPHLLWQAGHGWPTLELLSNAARYQFQPVTPLQFVWGQVQIVHPLTLPLWAGGLWYLLFDPRAARYRFLGIAFALQFGAFLWMQAKTYYLAPIYPVMFAAGSVLFERLVPARRRAWATAAVIGVLLAGRAIVAPYVMPVLPLEMLPRYVQWLSSVGLAEVRSERRAMGELPQIFADMLGAEELVAEIARVHDELSPDDRRRATIWTSDYGRAGAVDLFGRGYGLPPAISGHQNYYLWRPSAVSGEIVIVAGIQRSALLPWFDSVEVVGEARCDLCMPDRVVTPILLARGLRVPFDEFWPLVKCWTCDRPEFAKGAAPRPERR